MQTITLVTTILFFFGIYFLMLFLILSTRNRKLVKGHITPTKFPTVTFIVPAYNEANTIKATIESLLKIEYPENKKEILVVNDGSTDNTLVVLKALLKQYKGKFKVLDKKNSGKADSLNKAIKYAKGEFVAVVDADSCPKPNSLMRMIGFFEDDEKVAAVTSRVLIKNKDNFIEKYQDVDYEVIAWDRKILDFIDCVYVTNGPLSIYRKEILIKVGGFDPKNMTEDIEITWNLLSKEYKTRMAYSAEVYTGVPSDFKTWVKQRVRWNLGGLQTIHKYRKFFFRGKTLFGYFIINYLLFTFFLSLIGLVLIARYVIIKSRLIFASIPLLFQGYNPILLFEINLQLTLLLILGVTFFSLSVIYYKFILKDTYLKSKSILSIIIYTTVYRTMYLIPLVISLYKLIKRDIGWYTK